MIEEEFRQFTTIDESYRHSGRLFGFFDCLTGEIARSDNEATFMSAE